MASMKPTMLVALVALLAMAVTVPHAAADDKKPIGLPPIGLPPFKFPPLPPFPAPKCDKKGGICGDPKIVGGDGVTFYFHGRMNQDFCLVSDSDLHINAHFIGKRPEGRARDFTWVQALGFVYGPHALTIAAKRVAKWDNAVDQLQLSYNGQPLELKGSWTSPDGVIAMNRIGATNAVDLTIKEKMGVALTVVPIGEKESKVHGYGIGADDCFAHFDMQFRFYNLSSLVDGVLGQTYQPDYVNPTKRGVAMPIMGGADRFFSSSLLATDCKMSKYSGLAIPVGSAMPSFDAVCGSKAGSLSNGIPGGLICRR
ncbi:hypothetical protein M758_8G135500 [Ceratodon purpureus]|uniref:Uncharacterized protein n=1 Tax=Ceratodon purpureus TaxID=3225 RepID=A0A8T0H1Y1_CERPU|nr:hypothetical protein KC19_8G140200 [Ceratodon purpureus]KAG0608820.1 hypothetical protein M758_8G135500 [Ceratodon purpureus]